MDPGNEHWDFISILNSAHAGELFLKAAIAREHPLLLFKEIYSFDDEMSEYLEIENMIKRGKTHEFDRLPHILWAATGMRIENKECFDRLRKARNAIQHFCAPDSEKFSELSLEFIYTVIDPLISKLFGICAIDYHEDHSIGYDYIVARLIKSELPFTLSKDFDIGDISLKHELKNTSAKYQRWLEGELSKIGRIDLLSS